MLIMMIRCDPLGAAVMTSKGYSIFITQMVLEYLIPNDIWLMAHLRNERMSKIHQTSAYRAKFCKIPTIHVRNVDPTHLPN